MTSKPFHLRLHSGTLAAGMTWMLVGFASGAQAQAQDLSFNAPEHIETDGVAAESFPVNESDPESSVPTPQQAMRSPLRMGYHVMLLIEKGDAAMKRGEFAKAAQFYRAMVKATPERARSHSLLCSAYQALNDLPKATESCQHALGLAGVTVNDNVRYVQLLLSKPGALDPKDLENAEATIAHLEKELKEDKTAPLTVESLRCDVATRLEDERRLIACSDKLLQVAPKDPRTFAYRFALNLMRRDYPAAQRLIADAARAGMPQPAVARMQQNLLAIQNPKQATTSNVDWRALAVGCGALVAALGMYLIGKRRHARVSAA
jgi:hypothetical protein